MSEPVDIFVLDTTLSANPIAGVLVRVYSVDGVTLITEDVTDVSGKASFLLAVQSFQLRFFKIHVAIKNPKYIDVLVAPAINKFDVKGELLSPPTVTDPRLCMAFGFFRRPDGSPAPGVDIHFINKFNPLTLDGDAVLSERVIARTDEKGYLQVALIRNGKYDATVQGTEEYQRQISVPDAQNVSLPALLFPVVDRILFTPPGPFTVAHGQEIQVTPTIIASDGNVIEDGSGVQWSSSDQNILGVFPAGGVLTLRGVAAGTASIQAVRADQSIVRIPDPGVLGVPAPVTVT